MKLITRLSTMPAVLLLAACASVTPYQPLQDRVGYSEQKLESNRYHVSFAGSSRTPRATVDTYVLYRAAELTLANQYDYFTIASQNTQAEAPRSGGGFGFGVGGFSMGSGGGVGIGVGTSTSDNSPEYNGSADVVMFHGKKPDNDPHSYDARALQANLEPSIVRPH